MDASLGNADKICRLAAKEKSAETIGDALKSIEIYLAISEQRPPENR